MAKKLMKGCEAVAEAAIQAATTSSVIPSLPRTIFPNTWRVAFLRWAAASSRQRAKLLQSTWSTAQQLPVQGA